MLCNVCIVSSQHMAIPRKAFLGDISYIVSITILTSITIIDTRWVPVEWRSSVCLICMIYRIIILIIIIISLGQILVSYIANTSRTHAHARAHTHSRTHTHSAVTAVQVSAIRWRPIVTARSAGIHTRYQCHSNKHTHWPPDFPEILDVFRV